jgi:para-nitrobenzyl esterase
MHAFFCVNPGIVRLREMPLLGSRAFDALSAAVTARVFQRPAWRLADHHARAGARTYLYAFDWAPPASPFGACHTIDLPFSFGARDAWRDSPMLGGTPWSEVDAIGRALRRAWTTFARTGDPSAPGDAAWPAHRPGARPARRFA